MFAVILKATIWNSREHEAQPVSNWKSFSFEWKVCLEKLLWPVLCEMWCHDLNNMFCKSGYVDLISYTCMYNNYILFYLSLYRVSDLAHNPSVYHLTTPAMTKSIWNSTLHVCLYSAATEENEVWDINSYSWGRRRLRLLIVQCTACAYKAYFLWAAWDILDPVTCLMCAHNLIYGEGQRVSEGKEIRRGVVRRSAPVIQETGWCHFDREQRGPCWCQREARHPDKLGSSSLPLYYSLSLSPPHNLWRSQLWLVYLSH